METTTTAIDPVCGMTVDPATTRRTSAYRGTTAYFCSPACKKAFDADPAGYLAKTEREVTPEQAGDCTCCKVQA